MHPMIPMLIHPGLPVTARFGQGQAEGEPKERPGRGLMSPFFNGDETCTHRDIQRYARMYVHTDIYI